MDAESFKKEFLPYHRKLYCIAYRLLENAADAEDLVQEAYLKLWDKREGLAIISNPEAFSVTLVKNMCFDLLRSGKYTLSRQSVELAEVHNMSQADNFEVRDEAQQVRHIIAHLTIHPMPPPQVPIQSLPSLSLVKQLTVLWLRWAGASVV